MDSGLPTPDRKRRGARARSLGSLAWVCFILLASSLGASTPTPRFVNLTREDGLSDNNVEHIVQDNQGFLWIGTGNGLNRFDGYDFKIYRYDSEDPESLSGNFVLALLVDREGTLWVGAGGLNRYLRDSDTFIRYVNDDADSSSISNENVHALAEDLAGRLWVGTFWGLNLLDKEDGTFTRYVPTPEDPGAGPSGPRIRAVHAARDGTIWVGVQDGGLNRMDPATGRFVHYRHDPEDPSSLASDNVWDVHEDSSGYLWVATHHGLHRLDRESDTFVRYSHDPADPYSLASDRIDATFQDSRGRLWVASDGGGLAFLQGAPEEGQWINLRRENTDPTSLASDVVRSIYEDQIGDLWISTYSGGISFYNADSNFFTVERHLSNKADSLSDSRVLCFHQDESTAEGPGGLWIGTEGGLNYWDRDRGTFQVFRHDETDPASLGADAVLAITRDRHGEDSGALWVGTFFGGLNRLDPETHEFTRFLPQPQDPTSLSNPHVFALYEDREGHLWIGTFGGINRRDPGSDGFIHYRHTPEAPETIGHDIIWSFLEDRTGRIWIGTQGGLSLYHRERDSFSTYRHIRGDSTSLSSSEVLVLHEDPSERLWIGTAAGLNLFDPDSGTAQIYRTASGLANDFITGIVDSGDGTLWLSTTVGLSHFDPTTEKFVNYDTGDGVLAVPMTKKAAYRGRDGILFFGGVNGLVHFRPENVRDNLNVPPVVLTDIRIVNERVAVGENERLQRQISVATDLSLGFEDRVVTFHYSALNFRSPESNQYAYKLEPFDETWNAVGNTRTATYTNLDPGEYIFRVKGSNNSGVWNNDGAQLRLSVAPPYWKTWWFRSLLGLIAAMIIAGAHGYRTQAIRANNRALQAQIEERQLVEAERATLLKTMEEKNTELEAKNAELERFTYTVSHDLKSPLVTIQGFVGMLAQDAKAGKLDRMETDIARIKRAAGMMHRLLNELLELSRIGRIANPSERVSLTRIVQSAVHQLKGEVQTRNVTIEIADPMPEVFVDRSRIQEVFQNLIENALKFIGEQTSPRIEVGATQDAAEVRCWVRDNGIGIDPRYQKKIFDLFERVQVELNGQPIDGTGVGLAIVKRIVEVHGGRVWVESEGLGHGSTFFFTLAEEPSDAGKANC